MSPQDLYRIRDFVPDFDAISVEFTRRSQALTASETVLSGIRYGDRDREVMDIILPKDVRTGAPLHVFVHGGYWRSGEKENYRLVAEPIIAAGAVAAIIEYDLMPLARLDLLIDQVRRAVLWLQTHAGRFGADPLRITVSGHSAGAHLSSFLAACGADEQNQPSLPAIRGLLLVSGIYDLSGIPGSFLCDEARMTEAEAASWSPLTSRQLPCPSRIIAVGADETEPFHVQAASLQSRLTMAGEPAQLLTLQGLNHMNIVLDLADPQGQLGRRLMDLIATN